MLLELSAGSIYQHEQGRGGPQISDSR